MVELSDTLSFYKRKDIQDAIVSYSVDREVCAMYGLHQFGKRPDILNYPGDVMELVKQRATSFHISEELWDNPLQLSSEMRREQLDENRKGWDLVLDIDCNWFDYSKIAASLIVQRLKYHGIKSISVKFSGNHGFHIGVPFEAFPERLRDKLVKDLFPEVPRVIAAYLKYRIKGPLGKKIIEFEEGNFPKILEKTGCNRKDVVYLGEEDGISKQMLNAEPFLEIDTILISSRHLYRAPYSFNEKSGLISVPIDPNKILEFDKESAKPENVKVNNFVFLDRTNVIGGEVKEFFVEAYDYDARDQKIKDIKESLKDENKVKRSYDDEIQQAIPRDFFPPCIQAILNGVKDGKKRSLFILTNFLTTCGWAYEDIENLLHEWNKKNNEQGEMLREVMIKGQLRYHKQRKKKILPPNCRRAYEDFQVCKPDALCVKMKNPVSYAKRKAYFARTQKQMDENKGRAVLTEEQKEMRKKYREKVKKEGK